MRTAPCHLPGSCNTSASHSHRLAVLVVVALGLVPLTLALVRLWAVTGITPVEALFTVHQQPGAMEALRFSLLEALASTLLSPWPLVSRLHGPSGAIGGEGYG